MGRKTEGPLAKKSGLLGFSSPQRRRWLLLGLASVLLLLAGLGYWEHYSAERQDTYVVKQAANTQQQLVDALESIRRRLDAVALERLPRTAEEARIQLSGRVPAVREVSFLPRRLEQFDPQTSESGYSLLSLGFEARRDSPSQFHWLRSHADAPLTLAYSLPETPDSGVDDFSDPDTPGYAVISLGADALTELLNKTEARLGFAGLQQSLAGQYETVLSMDGFVPVSKKGARRLPIQGATFEYAFPARPEAGWLQTDGRYKLIALLAVLVALASIFQGGPRLSSVSLASLINRLRGRAERTEQADSVLDTALATAAAGSKSRPKTEAETAGAKKEDQGARRELSEPASKQETTTETTEEQSVQLDASIFRAYDIRGVVGQTLDEGVAHQIGQAVGTLALQREASPVVVARDGRLSGPTLSLALQEGIQASGCDVVDIGAAPTPVLYFAAHEAGSGSGVAVTGSHNPPDYNGFKIMIGGDTLSGDEIKNCYRLIRDGELLSGDGNREEREMLEAYRQRIKQEIQLSRDLKVVVDCGNGIAGVVAPDVLRDVGAEVFALFDEVDGTFPNHHPDPSEPENLEELKSAVKMLQADLGLAFDGDGDRLGIVTADGEMIFPDRAMILFARELLEREPGATVIFDVKCSGHLPDAIEEAGGKPLMWKTGHSLVKAKMKEVGAPLAGEMSGHFFFGKPWYGFDDAIYGAAKLLQILANTPGTPTQTLNELPNSVSTPELKVHMQEGQTFRFIQAFREQARFDGGEISTIDGVRVDWPHGWGLVRSSNTTPVLVLRFDADSQDNLDKIKEVFRSQMLAVNDSLELPF